MIGKKKECTNEHCIRKYSLKQNRTEKDYKDNKTEIEDILIANLDLKVNVAIYLGFANSPVTLKK